MPLQNFSNPLVWPHLHFYSERPDGPITEIWHSDKWQRDLDPANFSLMYNDLQGRHYYINELAWMKNGGYIIPVQWVKWRGCVLCIFEPST